MGCDDQNWVVVFQELVGAFADPDFGALGIDFDHGGDETGLAGEGVEGDGVDGDDGFGAGAGFGRGDGGEGVHGAVAGIDEREGYLRGALICNCFGHDFELREMVCAFVEGEKIDERRGRLERDDFAVCADCARGDERHPAVVGAYVEEDVTGAEVVGDPLLDARLARGMVEEARMRPDGPAVEKFGDGEVGSGEGLFEETMEAWGVLLDK